MIVVTGAAGAVGAPERPKDQVGGRRMRRRSAVGAPELYGLCAARHAAAVTGAVEALLGCPPHTLDQSARDDGEAFR